MLNKKLQNLSINSARLYEKAQGKNFNVYFVIEFRSNFITIAKVKKETS